MFLLHDFPALILTYVEFFFNRNYLNQTNPNILIRYFNAELLLGLAKHCAVELCGHFNQMITAEQEITLSSCSRSLEKTINPGIEKNSNRSSLLDE